MQNARQVASLGSLERQRRNQGRANTASILSRQDLHRVLLLGVALRGPVEDLSQGLGAAGLEVRVLVEDGSVGSDVAALKVLLLADGRDTAGGQSGGSCADELCQSPDQLKLGSCGGDVELRLEGIKGLLEVLEGVPFCRLVSVTILQWQVFVGLNNSLFNARKEG